MQWYGVVGPAGMPADVVKQLNDTLNAVLKAPDLREKLSVEAVEPMPDERRSSSASTSAPTSRAGPQLAKDRKIQLDS